MCIHNNEEEKEEDALDEEIIMGKSHTWIRDGYMHDKIRGVSNYMFQWAQ